MSRIRFVLATLIPVALSAAINSSSEAASLRISPILIDAGEAANTTVILLNQDVRPLNAQVRVFRWSQQEGKDVLEPTDDVIASPPIVSVPASGEYTVRLQRSSGKELVGEEAYRIVIDELPNPNRQRNGTVAIVMRYIVPAFFASAEADNARIQWSVQHRDGRAFLVATNSGDKRVQLTDLMVQAGGRRVWAAKGLAGYVLANSTKEWPLSGPLPARGAVVSAGTGKSVIRAPLAP